MIEPKKSIKEMVGYFVPLYENTYDIKIDSNENNYGPSPLVIKELQNCTFQNISFYPFYGELSQKIADYCGFDIENIKVTNGADEALQGIIQTYMEENETLLTVCPSFEMPNVYASIQGGKIKKVEFEEKWVFPIDNFLKNITDEVKIIYLGTPNNPTGSIIEENDLVKIIEKAKDKVVIIDETYANYWGKTYNDYAKKYDNVFIVHSFSKDFALAGMRLGYIISNKENINILKKVISPFSVNTFAMKAGIIALSDTNYFAQIKKEILSSKQELKTFFESLNFKVYDSFANFLLIDCGSKAEFIYTKLKNANIAIKLFKKGSGLENHIRITIPTTLGTKKIKELLSNKPFLVFDMDGVLIDASKSYRLAIEKTYEYFANEPISQNAIQEAKNLGGLNNDWDLTDFLLKGKGINVKYQDLVDKFQSLYWEDGKGFINNEVNLFDIELFEDLSKNYNLAIFTGRLRAEAMYALNRLKTQKLFCPIITTDDIPEGKGKPDSFGLNLIKEKTYGEKYYYFGDTVDDVTAAKNANYVATGVLPPQDKSEELTQSLKKKGAQFVLKSINELQSILEKNNERVC